MEQEEKKTKRTSPTKGTNTAKKVNSTKRVTAQKTVATKKEGSTTAKTTTKKSSTSKEPTTKKAASTKAVPAKKTATVENAKAASTKAAEKKADSIKKVPVKKKTTVETEKADKDEEITLKDDVKEVVLNQEQELNNKVAKEQDNKKQRNEKNKKYIDISIGAIICAIIIIALIILNIKLGKQAYGMLNSESTNSNIENNNNVGVVQEIGNVLNRTDDLVTKMKEKITFPSNVTASIYDTQGFDSTTIPNELKLILGWAKSEDGSKLKSINEKNQEVEALEDEAMSENIKSILGPNTKYTDKSFDYAKIDTFAGSAKNQETINYSDGLYRSILTAEAGEELQPLIYQEIQKVVRYSEKVIVYVKVAFIDVDGDNYQVYKNFENDQFGNRLLQIKPDKLFEDVSFNKYTGEGTVAIEENSALNSVRETLNTYKYTFTLDETTQEYYLSEFAKDNV